MNPLRRISKKNLLENGTQAEYPTIAVAVPANFQCPVSLELMKDPVTLCTGITYDRQSIEIWLDAGNLKCPVTNQALKSTELIPNHLVRRMLQDWCVNNSSFGIERIPTPRIPITAIEVSEILSGIMAAFRRGDHIRCHQFVEKINIKGKESERNRQCIIANGTGCVLSSAFVAFSAIRSKNSEGVLEEILSALIWMFPFDGEARSHLAINKLDSVDKLHANALVDIEESIEPLVKLIKEPICPTTTEASLIAIFYLVLPSASAPVPAACDPNKKDISRSVEMDLVSLLLEMLVDSKKSICEKALAVLDGICECDKGREKAYDHPLTMPILVKMILRVSDLATQFAISIIWKVSKNYERDGEFLIKVLQVGVFQKLLFVLQVGCGEQTKKKASILLGLLNTGIVWALCLLIIRDWWSFDGRKGYL